LNLALNSRQAMPKGGQLTVTTESRTIDEVLAGRLPGGRAGEFVCLTVKDSGEGISPHVMSRLLAPFSSQEGGEGAGLGLAAVRGIVQRHDGWIQVESEPSVGTTFRIFLPVSVEDSAVTLLPSPEAQVARGKETILLVEDEAQVRGLAVVVLQKQGYRVLEATKAEEALDVWKRHASRIDLLFTDLVMTGEITGQELAEQLQAEKPSLKVIYTSGYSVEKGAEIFALKAETPFVQKPYSPKKLAETVRQTLDGSKKTPA
jgi:CheY-like chemotaxis protein